MSNFTTKQDGFLTTQAQWQIIIQYVQKCRQIAIIADAYTNSTLEVGFVSSCKVLKYNNMLNANIISSRYRYTIS